MRIGKINAQKTEGRWDQIKERKKTKLEGKMEEREREGGMGVHRRGS